MVLSERHGPPSLEKHVRSWSQKHEEEVQQVLADVTDPARKAVFIEGDGYAGKTTLAAAVGQALPEEWDIHVTLPQLQHEFSGVTIQNERTGILYKKLPPASAIEKPTLIIMDELKYPPEEELWKPYTENPQTKFIILSSRNNPHREAWNRLFTEEGKPQRIRQLVLTP